MESHIWFYTFLAYACRSITVLKRLFIIPDVVKNYSLLTKQYANSFITLGITLPKRNFKKGLDRKSGNHAREKDFKSDCWRSTNPIRSGERQ